MMMMMMMTTTMMMIDDDDDDDDDNLALDKLFAFSFWWVRVKTFQCSYHLKRKAVIFP